MANPVSEEDKIVQTRLHTLEFARQMQADGLEVDPRLVIETDTDIKKLVFPLMKRMFAEFPVNPIGKNEFCLVRLPIPTFAEKLKNIICSDANFQRWFNTTPEFINQRLNQTSLMADMGIHKVHIITADNVSEANLFIKCVNQEAGEIYLGMKRLRSFVNWMR